MWTGEIFTQISINLFNFFVILLVYNLSHSNTAVSGIVISFTIPAIIFGSLAGVYVDRWNKKKVLIVTNIVRAVLMVVMAFFISNLFLIYVLTFVVSVMTQYFIPAESPIIPLVVSRKNLLSANALFGMGIYGSILVAYILSGPMILILGDIKTLLILSVLLLIGAAIISVIKLAYTKPKPVNKTEEKPNLVRDLRHTFSMISRTKEVYNSLFLLSLSQILILVVATIAPGYASQILGIKVESFSMLFVAPAALGVVVAAVVIVNFLHKYKKEKLITTGLFLSGMAMLFLPFGSRVASRSFVHTINSYLPHFLMIDILHIMVILAFILGFANALVFVPSNTILQEKTTEEFRGRVYGFMNTLVGIFSLLPIILVGSLSDLIGVGQVIIGIGVILLILGITRLF